MGADGEGPRSIQDGYKDGRNRQYALTSIAGIDKLTYTPFLYILVYEYHIAVHIIVCYHRYK